MEKKTNWSEVYIHLDDALDFFESEDCASVSVRDIICALMALVRSFM